MGVLEALTVAEVVGVEVGVPVGVEERLGVTEDVAEVLALPDGGGEGVAERDEDTDREGVIEVETEGGGVFDIEVDADVDGVIDRDVEGDGEGELEGDWLAD